MKIRKSLVIFVSATTLCLSGCSTVNTQVTNFKTDYYPQCYKPIVDIAKDRDHSGEVAKAVAGVFVGALIGALVGASSNDSKGAIAGAAIGAAAGGALGFGLAKIQSIRDQGQRLEALQQTLGQDASDLNLDQASVLSAFRCYSGEIEVIKDAVAKKEMSREEAAKRIAEIRQGLENAKLFWDERATEMDKKVTDYDKFIAEEDQKVIREEHQRALAKAKANRAQLAASITAGNTKVNEYYELAKRTLMVADIT